MRTAVAAGAMLLLAAGTAVAAPRDTTKGQTANKPARLTPLAGCDVVGDLSAPCRAPGNTSGANGIGNVQGAIFDATGEMLALTLATEVTVGNGTYSFTYAFDRPVQFATVKAGDEFKLYQFQGGSLSGTVDTTGLANGAGTAWKSISHVSFWYGPLAATGPVSGGPNAGTNDGSIVEQPGSGSLPVPEPASFALFGLGAAGVAGAAIRRRRA